MEDPKLKPHGSEESETVRALVDAMSSPTLAVVLLICLVIIIAAGSQVPQGLALSELLRSTSFSWAKLAHGFGLGNVLTSWVLFLVVLLLLLNVLAIIVRRWSSFRAMSDIPPVFGPQRRSVILPEMSMEELRQRMTQGLGGAVIRVRGDRMRATRGATIEGLLLVGLGVIALVLGWFVERERVATGRIEVPVTMSEPLVPANETRVLIHTDSGWVAGGPAIRGACRPVDQRKPMNSFQCSFDGPFGNVSGVISPGAPLQAADLLIGLQGHTRSARSGKGAMEVTHRKTHETAFQAIKTGQAFDIGASDTGPNEQMDVADIGERNHVAVHAGADGLLITVDPSLNVVARILSGVSGYSSEDAGVHSGSYPPLALAFRVFGEVTLVFWYTTVRHLWLFLLGALVVLLGVIALMWVPHVVVVAWPMVPSSHDGRQSGSVVMPSVAANLGYVVTVQSNNNPALCERIVGALAEVTPETNQD